MDALDEDAKSRSRGGHRLVNYLEKLAPEVRDRLLLLLFARENEVPDDLRKRLGELYGEGEQRQGRGLVVIQLAALDAANARDYLGDEQFEDVCELIRANRLQSIAGYPSALDRLRRFEKGAVVSDVDVWRVSSPICSAKRTPRTRSRPM